VTSDLEAATTRLLATVDALPDPDWAGPSHCTGWSRAHVVAHLALNAEALGGVLRGIAQGRPTTMYASDEARDADIEALAATDPDEVRARLHRSAELFDAALAAAGHVAEGTTFERTPGGRVMPADVVPFLRLGEVEIHHADLDAGYSWADWPAATARAFLGDHARRPQATAFVIKATDEDARWSFGTVDDGVRVPTVSGPLRALAWWATGRDPGPVLSSSEGTLPTMEGR
jgi:maleylpyruvate isomerase